MLNINLFDPFVSYDLYSRNGIGEGKTLSIVFVISKTFQTLYEYKVIIFVLLVKMKKQSDFSFLFRPSVIHSHPFTRGFILLFVSLILWSHSSV